MFVDEDDSCTRCGSRYMIMDPNIGEVVCGDCGLVVREAILNRAAEWRAFNSHENERRSRTSLISITYFDMGLSTVFSGTKDASGKSLGYKKINRMRWLRKYDTRYKLDATWMRNLRIAMAELDRLSIIHHIPMTVKENAAKIYRKALKHDLIRGRSIDAFVAASLYAACRIHRIPRSLKSISRESSRNYSEISRSYRLLIQELVLKMPIDDPFKFVSGIASKLKIRRQTEMRAIDILKKAKKQHGLSGKEPRGIAAAALYMACLESDEKRRQSEVANAAKTTEVTLRNRLRGLKAILKNSLACEQ